MYLKQNPLNLDTIAYKGHEDPPQILNFIRKYINPEKLYKQVLHKKIMMLYEINLVGMNLQIHQKLWKDFFDFE